MAKRARAIPPWGDLHVAVEGEKSVSPSCSLCARSPSMHTKGDILTLDKGVTF